MPILKSKMSKSAWVLVALLIIAVVSLPILHLVGFIDLSFIGEVFMGVLTWGSTDALNGLILLGGVFAFGMLTYYTLKKYILGTKVPATAGTYTPVGQTISPSQQQEQDMVVSD